MNRYRVELDREFVEHYERCMEAHPVGSEAFERFELLLHRAQLRLAETIKQKVQNDDQTPTRRHAQPR